MSIPVVIATNGLGIPVVEALDGAGIPVVVAESGYGIPVVVAENGVGLPVVGLEAPDPSAPVVSSVDITPPGGPAGTTFTASASVSGYPTPARAWQWKLDGDDIDGATGSTYLSTEAGALTVVLTVTSSEGSASLASAPVTVVEAAAPGGFSSGFSSGFEVAA